MLNMVEMVNPKLDQVLEKLHKLEHQIQSVDEKVKSLQAKIEYFKATKKETETKIKEFEDRLNFANAERELFKRNFKKNSKKKKSCFRTLVGVKYDECITDPRQTITKIHSFCANLCDTDSRE